MGVLVENHKDEIASHLEKYPTKLSALMPILYIAQREYGHLSDETIKEIAEIVEADETHVKSVAGFYTMYFDEPKGKYLVQVCVDLPCALAGAEEVAQAVCEYLGVECGDTTEDGLFTVEKVVCQGACDHSAVISVNFEQYHDLNAETAIELIESLREA